MKHRPWPIVILAILHCLAPLFITFFASVVMKMGYFTYLSAWFQRASLWGLISVLALYPIAGVAIYMMKPWSFPVFVGIFAVGIVSDFNTWKMHPNLFTLPTLLGFTILNFAVVTYFLIPAVRETYFNRRLRWWENQPRYRVRFPAEVVFSGKTVEAVIGDLSEGGAFIRLAQALMRPGDRVELRFTILNKVTSVLADVVHHRDQRHGGYGVKFVLDSALKKQMKSVVKAFDVMGFRRYPPKMDWAKSFQGWLSGVFKTGRGLVPERDESGREHS